MMSQGERAHAEAVQRPMPNGRASRGAPSQAESVSDAAAICKMKQALGEPWNPQDDGFVFSSEGLSVWTHRRDLIDQANKFLLCACPPESETEQ